MSNQTPQNFANHRFQPISTIIPFVLLALGGIAVLVSTLIPAASMGGLLPGLATGIIGLTAAAYVLKARYSFLALQDRIIRLEMQVRLDRLLSGELRDRARTLSLKQLIALRFASDAELPALVQVVLDKNITDQTAIK
jgi:hypothetical protein